MPVERMRGRPFAARWRRKREIGDLARGDLEQGYAEARRGDPRSPRRTAPRRRRARAWSARSCSARVVLGAQLEPRQHLALSPGAARRLALVLGLGRDAVDEGVGAKGLELHRVRARVRGGVDEAARRDQGHRCGSRPASATMKRGRARPDRPVRDDEGPAERAHRGRPRAAPSSARTSSATRRSRVGESSVHGMDVVARQSARHARPAPRARPRRRARARARRPAQRGRPWPRARPRPR